ncbi:MAG: ATP-dependent sacrificial sulfur transferase LarE [Planctomycetales bacterium]|nr:ATP-dependent sacrificial sulfur transferase LarE [Planctomycetales bacterium]
MSELSSPLSAELSDKTKHLLEQLAKLESCAVAFSAGVDSTVVAKAAALALGSRALAVTAVSPSLATGELAQARQLAALIGIRHLELPTAEMGREGYRQNGPDRCYHCKSELYTELEQLAKAAGVHCILNGANVDDLGDYRPGLAAAAEHAVLSPLVDAGINKQEVRELARHWSLPVWDKPASPCLSSRIAYGEEVTEARLRRIDEAEQFLKSLGVAPCRVRLHPGELARIEAPLELLARLAEPETRELVSRRLRELGFQFVTLDLLGLQSGSLNQLLQIGGGAVEKSE